MLFIFTAQVHDRLVHHPEPAIVHGLENRIGGIGFLDGFVVRGVVYLDAVTALVAFQFLYVAGSDMGTPDQFFSLRGVLRSEERRVGKESRSRWWASH